MSENSRRRTIANKYLEGIKNDKLILPKAKEELAHVWHLFVIRTDNRDKFQNYLTEKGVQTMIHYPVSPHKQKAFKAFNHLQLPITEEIHKTVLSLPVDISMSDEQVDLIIDACNKY